MEADLQCIIQKQLKEKRIYDQQIQQLHQFQRLQPLGKTQEEDEEEEEDGYDSGWDEDMSTIQAALLDPAVQPHENEIGEEDDDVGAMSFDDQSDFFNPDETEEGNYQEEEMFVYDEFSSESRNCFGLSAFVGPGMPLRPVPVSFPDPSIEGIGPDAFFAPKRLSIESAASSTSSGSASGNELFEFSCFHLLIAWFDCTCSNSNVIL